MLSKPSRAVRFGALLVLAAAAGGCGKSTATLSGTVTYRGRPVTSGEVVFLAADGRTVAHAPIGPDGYYTVQGVPPGQARVAVDNPPPSWYATAQRLPAALANDPEVREARSQAAHHVAGEMPWLTRRTLPSPMPTTMPPVWPVEGSRKSHLPL